MRTVQWLLLGLIIHGSHSLAATDLFRWVDANGTVHYSVSCPAGIECTRLSTGTAPSPEATEAARRRSEELLGQRRERSAATGQQEQQQRDAASNRVSVEQATAKACERAFADRDVLSIDLPVYRDAEGILHHRESLHHHIYQGERTYLEDGQRVVELERVNRLIREQCAGRQPERTSYVHRYRDHPNLDEMLGILNSLDLPTGPPRDDTCFYARQMLADRQALHTGIPSDKERELERLVDTRCR